jgi:PAS domain S-box-containing protein
MNDQSPASTTGQSSVSPQSPRDAERYRAFISNSSEGIWCLEFDPPIDTSLPAATQVELAYQNGRFADANDAMARMYGLSGADELVGKTLDFMLPASDSAAREYLTSIVEAGYRAVAVESTERDVAGRPVHFANSMMGIVEDGRLRRMWGTQRNISERKRAEATQAYLAAIVESSDDAILSKDLNGIVQSCNRSAERLFGYAAEELIGRSVRVLIPHDRQAEEDYILERIRQGNRIDHFETIRRAKDGRLIDISLTVSPVLDSFGTIIGVSKVARDITEQKRIAAELAVQQAWFRVTLASIGDAVIASDPDGRIKFMNATAERLTGWRADEAQGRPLHEVFRIVNEKTRAMIENPAAVVMRVGEPVGLANHTVLIARDGVERPIADSGAPIRGDDGRIIGVVLVFRDVSEERRAEEVIAEQRQWFETTLESIGDGVIATDLQGRVAFMNPVAEHLTGWRFDDARGRVCSDVFKIVNEATRLHVTSPVTRVLAEGVVVGLANHTILIAADGTERPIDDSGAPIRNHEGRVVGVVLVFRDVTERRRTETERQATAVDRERLLEAERLARADAERANRVKDEFVAMVSHELRTPLNAILGWIQLMTQSRNDASVVERGLSVVARNTRLQVQLISDLLDISRIVAGKLRLEVQPVDLASVIVQAIETVQHQAGSKSISIQQELDAIVGLIAGDPARMEQVVWNLLANAIKFTPSGGQVSITLRSTNSHAQITVRDNGAGIRPEILPHIFDRFQQANSSITRRFGGLGLGLAIVKHLVELHGGSVRAESGGEGLGAAFTVLIPAGRAPHSLETERGSRDREDTLVPVSLDAIRVLVVEDEPDTREFLKRLLETNGATVVVVGSAADALVQVRNRPFDVVISDIGLPDVDGYDLLRRIREHSSAGASVPAIALTAYARPEDRRRALRAGYQAHLAKPVEPTDLLATIVSFVGLMRDADEKRDGDR